MEAERLSIYFEEIGAYHYKKNKELQSKTTSSGSREEVVMEFQLSDDETAELVEDE